MNITTNEIKNIANGKSLSAKAFYGILALSFTGVAAHAQGAILVDYDLSGFQSQTSTTISVDTAGIAGNQDSNLETVVLSMGSGGATNFTTNNWFGTDVDAFSSEALAVSNGYYFEFTLDPKDGYQFSLDTTNSIQLFTRNWSDSGDSVVFVRSDANGDNFQTTLATYTHPVTNNSHDGIRSLNITTGFTDITTATIFRVYAYDPNDVMNTWIIRGSGNIESGADFVVRGVVTAVPEPSTYALISGIVVLLGLLVRKNRRRLSN